MVFSIVFEFEVVGLEKRKLWKTFLVKRSCLDEEIYMEMEGKRDKNEREEENLR